MVDNCIISARKTLMFPTLTKWNGLPEFLMPMLSNLIEHLLLRSQNTNTAQLLSFRPLALPCLKYSF